MTRAACHAAGEPRNAGPPATREPGARGLPLSPEHRELLLAHERGRAHLVEVDPGRDRVAIVVRPVPVDVVLAGRELAVGEGSYLPPRRIVEAQLHLLPDRDAERDPRGGLAHRVPGAKREV